ncbi:MAG: SpoIIIAH-like family protein [Acutalibacteraceae bacterium]
MNVIIKRRQLVLATLVVALGAAVFVNWYYTENKNNLKEDTTGNDAEYVQNLGEAEFVNAKGETADYFTQTKLNRQKAHDETLENLKESLKNTKSGSNEAAEITKSIDALTEQIKAENDIETLVSAKTNSECVVVLNDTSAQIIVMKGVLTEDIALQISEIVTANTDLPASSVVITEQE